MAKLSLAQPLHVEISELTGGSTFISISSGAPCEPQRLLDTAEASQLKEVEV